MAKTEKKSEGLPAEKPKYHAPTLLHLGEATRGSAACTGGTSNIVGECVAGAVASFGDCNAGQGATTACTVGGAALGVCNNGSSGT